MISLCARSYAFGLTWGAFVAFTGCNGDGSQTESAGRDLVSASTTGTRQLDGTNHPESVEEVANALVARPLRLPTIASSSTCPVSEQKVEAPRVAIAIGDGPALVVLGMSEPPPKPGSIVHYEGEGVARFDGLFGTKALWVVNDYDGVVLLRGGQLDGPGEMRFQQSEGDPIESSLQFPPGSDEWRYFPSAIFLGRAGCYGVQVDAIDFTQMIVFQAAP